MVCTRNVILIDLVLVMNLGHVAVDSLQSCGTRKISMTLNSCKQCDTSKFTTTKYLKIYGKNHACGIVERHE